MKRTATITLTCDEDDAWQGAVICEAKIDPPVNVGTTSLVAQTVMQIKELMGKLGTGYTEINGLRNGLRKQEDN